MTATDTTATDTTAPDDLHGEKSLPFLAQVAADLLALAEDAALPLPRSIRVSQVCQDISLSFHRDRDSFSALTVWAQHFGAVITGHPHTGDDGQESTYCEVKFTHGGTSVEAYAFITAGQTSST
jgi:hypothetical protein